MANMRAKNRRLTTICFTDEEVAEMEPIIKAMKTNRSDFVRMALNDWIEQKKRISEKAAKNHDKNGK
jgi:metal-responsive CopG/Arc/MetJ family transcriptional regulator